MNLIDAIKNVVKPEAKYAWDYSAPIEALCEFFRIQTIWNEPDEMNARFKSYPIFNWYCTDTHVGLDALYLDGEPVGCTFQSARKCGRDFRWLSRESALKVRAFLLSFLVPEEETIDIIPADECVNDKPAVAYVSQLLTDEGFYDGRPVRVLVKYDGLGQNTDPKYRVPGRSYFESVPYGDSKDNCLLVQDGDEQRIISIQEFKIPLNVVDV